jgi:hypothetical protein
MAATREGSAEEAVCRISNFPFPNPSRGATVAVYKRLLVDRRGAEAMGGLLLALVIIPGLIGLAAWERGGGHVPKMPEVELPVHGVPALLFGLAIAMLGLAIIAIDLAVISRIAG